MDPTPTDTTGDARRRRPAALACLLAALVTVAAACGSSPGERRTAATRDPARAVERALEEARGQRTPEATEAPSPGEHVGAAPAASARAVRGRDELAIGEVDEPVRLDDRRVVERLPAGLSRSDVWETTLPSPRGDLRVAVVAFRAEDPDDAIALDVRLVEGEPRAVARERQRDLADRSAVEETRVRGRDAVAYATGPATRTLRWIEDDDTLVVLDGMGLSTAALTEIGRSIRLASTGGDAVAP